MSRDKYVSREGLKQWLEELIKSPYAESTETRLALELVRDAAAMKVPASMQIQCADVEPVVHAQWIINADGYYPYCSACKKEPPGRCMTAHCPNCGARMDAGEEGCG